MLMMSHQSLVVASLLLSPLTAAFLVPCCSRPRRSAFHVPPSRRFSSSSSFVSKPTASLCAKKDGEDDDTRDGMDEAFGELEALGPLGDDDFQPKSRIDDTRKGFEEVDVELPVKSEATPEAQVRLYKDMYTESEKGETELYSNLLSDMGGTPPAPKPVEPFEEELVELIESVKRTPEDLDIFLNNALAEALAETRSKTPDELALDAENALNDGEMMKEIEEVFEKANKELLASIEEIRTEQAALAKASAEESAQSRMDDESENARRLEQAQESMSKILQKVNEETLQVEKAVLDLKAAQDEIAADPLVKLKAGGLVKQGALVGAALFSVRAIGEVLAMVGPNGELHTAPALFQGAIALACAAYFFLF